VSASPLDTLGVLARGSVLAVASDLRRGCSKPRAAQLRCRYTRDRALRFRRSMTLLTEPSVVGVSNEHRLKRLRDLLAGLERLPATADRERMLREVRARIVDVDTGVSPRAMLPVDLDSTLAADPAAPTTRASRPLASTPSDDGRRAGASALPEPEKPVHLTPSDSLRRAAADVAVDGSVARPANLLPLAPDVLLSLDDSPSFAPSDAQAGPTRARWTRGLRG
jgi:hypothetical protein